MARLVAYAPFDSHRVLRSIRLVSPVDRSVSASDNYRVRVGIAQEARIDWVGEWDGASAALKGHVPLTLGGRADLNRKIPVAGCLVVDTERRGLPAALRGSAVLMRVGSDLVPSAQRTLDREVQDGFEAASDFQSALGAGVEPVRVALDDGYEPFADDARHDAAVTISSTTFTNGNVSVTVRVAPGQTVYVKATAACNFVSTSGAAGALLYAAIGDGTTDHNFQSETCGVATALLFDEVTVTFAGRIDKTTTFTLRLAVDGGAATASVTNQTLAVIAAPVIGA